MTGDDGIIDLLSDSDDEASSGIAKAAASSDVVSLLCYDTNDASHAVKADDEIVILSDTETNTKETRGNVPATTSSHGYAVHNPYAKKTTSQLKEHELSYRHCSKQDPDQLYTNREGKVTNDSDPKLSGKYPPPDCAKREIYNPYKKKRKESEIKQSSKKIEMNSKHRKTNQSTCAKAIGLNQTELQAGLVFEEDVYHIQPSLGPIKKTASLKQASLLKKKSVNESEEEEEEAEARLSAHEYTQHQITTRISHNLPPILFHDSDFIAGNPASIDGVHIINKTSKKSNIGKSASNEKCDFILPPAPKCRCRPPKPCILAYSSKEGLNYGRPYYRCPINSCKYFSWAFTSYMLHWYRFGAHNGHVLVKPGRGFRAEDLVQGKVGDCWFLSALAVVAERDDLIDRLVGGNLSNDSADFGVIEVTLFVDGYWKKIVIDNFLPCIISAQDEKKEEDDIKIALEQSLIESGVDSSCIASVIGADVKRINISEKRSSSRFDPNALADECRSTLHDIHEFLHHDRFNKDPYYHASALSSSSNTGPRPLNRHVTTSDLAYSKAKYNQLWVPFIEKAYAKMHGSYRAISGGHVAEAFLDLTGAPTAVYNFDHHDFNPKAFWKELMTFRRKRLPMGCGTTSSQEGIVGMHAYSILDVREVKNVSAEFFYDKIVSGTLGNVSGFTDLDGTVRLLRIRNPHGQGEWKGEFSDKSDAWQKLLAHKNNMGTDTFVDLTEPMSPELERTMVNDGTFWIGYDDFLMGFSNVDVVLAFQGNHAKSFASNFPPKISNHRSSRAFELSAVGRQPGEQEPVNDEIEVFLMCIQKTRRGAYHGRADRKKSYKACDIGILVGETTSATNQELEWVDGRFFGLTRNGHIRLVLNRRSMTKMIVMPVSFGHPAATDEELSFVVRFVSDSPLLVRELAKPPRMHIATQKFCFGRKSISLGLAGTSRHRGLHCSKTVLLERIFDGDFLFRIIRVDCLAGDGGTVLFYMVVDDTCFSRLSPPQRHEAISFSLEVNCRGMTCRTANGIEKHEVISKGKKFEAAWRRFSLNFMSESKSRLFAALVQSGQDYQVGSVKCNFLPPKKTITLESSTQKEMKHKYENYEIHGIFAAVETPPNQLSRHNCQHGSVDTLIDSNPSFDNDLSLVLQKSREEYRAHIAKKVDDSTIPACHSPEIELSMIDPQLESAILASVMEHQASATTQSGSTEDEDIKKAIELSLKCNCIS
ncbi:hypothetical protein HJC23_002729 [Cyclotella cryptica]|uniref:Calpain catalytic domain-containing protein n=1 Tax=Cyclotella cryptica TaxID=29204 RepID=A0ABD3PQ77_9STRA|eukprot:CCRYP_012369-RA/>CCRYP_012369-RA protein AED:0.03 eAED:0.03 QI:93/1/1/1/1/1/2/1718/1215